MATQDQGSSHWQRPSVGAGIAVVSTFGPTLGLPIPLTLRWIGFSIGVLLIFWPPIVRAHRRVRQMNIEPWHLQIIGLVGVQVMEKYERYPDVIQEINWTDAPLMATTDALRLEIMRIRRLLGNDDRAELLLNNRFTEEWRESVNTFSNVIGRMKQTIRTLQTRYENSEIIDATK